jgi:hypothetical protein
MNKLLILSLILLTFAFNSFAGEPTGNNSTQTIGLEYHQKNNINTTVHRSPLHLNIEAVYNAELRTIEVNYFGDVDGEVYLYLNDEEIDYSPQISTSFNVTSEHGVLRLEIIGESWYATGSITI